jgi:hypothetical protein
MKYFCSCLILVATILGSHSIAALALPAPFNQTPATLEKRFGRYWTKLTTRDSDGTPLVTYTYSAARFRKLFPAYPASRLTIQYRNNQARLFQFQPYKTVEARDMGEPLLSADMQGENWEAKLFEGLFGYRSLIYRSLISHPGEYESSFTNCLDDGVATSYSFYFLSQQWLDGIILTHNPLCKPPADRPRPGK